MWCKRLGPFRTCAIAVVNCGMVRRTRQTNFSPHWLESSCDAVAQALAMFRCSPRGIALDTSATMRTASQLC
jgi:hypothetical protein